MRKATAFRGGANKTASPCEIGTGNKYLATVPVEQLQWGCLTENSALRENNCVRFGRIASLSACVLFAGGCVVRITFQSFLDFRFLEFFLFAKWRTAFAHFS